MNQEPKPTTKSLLRPFLDTIRRHWMAMALGGLLAFLAAGAAIGLLALSGWFIAAAAYAGLNIVTAKAFNFFLPSIGVRLFAMTRTVARYGERVICHDATFRILETLRTWCYRKLEPLSPARLERHHSGDLLTRIVTDIDTLDNLYLRVLSPSAVAAGVVAGLVIFIWTMDTVMALLCAILFMVAGVLIPLIAHNAARSTGRRLNEHSAHLRTVLVDGIHGLAALLTCGAETRYRKRLQDRHRELVASQYKMCQVAGWSKALTGMVGGVTVLAVLYLGVDKVAAGGLSGALLALIALAVMAAFDIVAPLTNAYQYLGQTRKAAGRLLEVTRQPPAVTFPAKSESAAPPTGPIEFDRVSFAYAGGSRPALENITFQIRPGQHTAVMGATGAGKSTLLYLLARFEDPSHGAIRIGGCPLKACSEDDLRNHICIIDQKAHIFNGTVRDNLLMAAPQATDDDIDDALSAVQLDLFIRGLPRGLETWVGEAGRLLSGGQARRLAIARAVLGNAPVWALDEPTEGLDTATAAAMMRDLITCGKDRTLVMITHRPEAVERMHQVIVLAEGRIAEAGAPETLKMHSDLYGRLISTRSRKALQAYD